MRQPGEKYLPSNGTEGDLFISKFCNNCKHENEGYDGCPIPINTMMIPVEHPEYPSEWTFDNNGKPVCTKFESKA